MNMVRHFVVLSCVLSAAAPSFAGQGAFQAGPLVERLEQAAAGADLNAVYDNSVSKGSVSAPQGSVSARTLLYRPQLDAPRVTPVHHLSDGFDPETGVASAPRPVGKNPAERGYNWMLHPATEMLNSSNPILNVAGVIAYVVLVIPAVIAAVLNSIAAGSRLTKGTSWHDHN